MNFDKYRLNTPYPDRKDYRVQIAITCKGNVRYDVEVDKDAYMAAVKSYREEMRKLMLVFKADLFEHLGIAGHPKADLLYDMAWDRRHSDGGLCGVMEEAEELARLLTWPACAG